MIRNKCYLKSIKNYEDNHNINVLSLVTTGSFHSLVELLSIIHDDIIDIDIYELLDENIKEFGYLSVYKTIINCVLGYDVINDNKKLNENELDNKIKDTLDDITTYNYLSDFYMHICMELMSLGMSYSEFWSLTTSEMYKVFSTIKQKLIIDYNRNMQIAHAQAAMIGGAVWGKLQKDAPRIDMEDTRDPDEIIDTEIGPMTREDYKLYKMFN